MMSRGWFYKDFGGGAAVHARCQGDSRAFGLPGQPDRGDRQPVTSAAFEAQRNDAMPLREPPEVGIGPEQPMSRTSRFSPRNSAIALPQHRDPLANLSPAAPRHNVRPTRRATSPRH